MKIIYDVLLDRLPSILIYLSFFGTICDARAGIAVICLMSHPLENNTNEKEKNNKIHHQCKSNEKAFASRSYTFSSVAMFTIIAN